MNQVMQKSGVMTWWLRGMALALAGTVSGQAALIGFYPFEGNANDVSGSGNDGTPGPNPPTVAAGGYEGSAYQFTAANNNYLTVPINLNPASLPEVTFGAWFKASTIGASGSVRGLISHDNGGFDRTLDLDTRGGSGLRWSAFSGVGVLGGSPVVADAWTFVAVRYDSAAGTVVLNVDGVQYSTAGTPGSSSRTTTTIGRNPGFDQPFDGLIDNVFFFDEVLSDARVEEIRLGGASAIVPEPGQWAWAGGLGALGVALARRRRGG